MTELAAPQISSLMEALPGIAAVLRSPVANAIVALSRAGAGLEEFRPVEAEELLRYGVRRNLLTQDEVDRILAEIREVVSHRPAKAGALATEKPKKAPVSPALVPPPKPAASAPMKAATTATPVKSATKSPAKPVAKMPAGKKAPQPSKAKSIGKKAPAKPAPKKPAAKKPAAKKPAVKKSAIKKHR